MLQRPSQRSLWSSLLLSAAVIAAAWNPRPLFAQDAAPAAAPAADATPPAPAADTGAAASQPGDTSVAPGGSLQQYADDFLHYSLVNNVDLAKANAQALLNANPAPQDLLAAFEAAANGRNPREIMLRNEKRDELRDVSAQLLDRLEAGYRAVARDPVRIRAEVDRLATSPRAYNNARDRLVAAGPYSVPIFIEYLQNSSKKDLQPYILRVMTDIGRPVLQPLLEALDTKDNALKLTLVDVIGQIGYPQALPKLRLLQADPSTDAQVKSAVSDAIHRIDRTGAAERASPADLFLVAGQNYYSHKASYQPLFPDEKTNSVWTFDNGLNNVTPIDVPTPIWDSVMAMRCAESALKIESNDGPAISLWLAASLRKAINLPAGAADPTIQEGKPKASFYALAAGPIYVNPVLAQALADRDSALALKAIDALEATGGTQGLVSGGNAPLIQALNYSDRAVRFRAAFALARANPANDFPSDFRVVPTLAEALGAQAPATVIVVSSDEDARNKLADALRSGEPAMTVFSAGTFPQALQQARGSAGISAVVVPATADMAPINAARQQDMRLSHAAVIVLATPDQALQQREANTQATVVDANASPDDIRAAIVKAEGGGNQGGETAVNPDQAKNDTTTAIDLLNTLAEDHKSIYKVTDALPALIAALKDKNPAVASGAATVIGHLNSSDGQQALAAAALSPDTDPSLRAPFFVALAESAKRTGNALDSAAVNNLIKEVSSETDLPTKNAAATALGALNVPSNQASALILQQIK
ncbi:MAG TPA: HEAT repeat domain-containing protein [Phycisphaerae bacterium]|nr:HEAT repeat domain-containing protein [Phycisphaerae bacterium]